MERRHITLIVALILIGAAILYLSQFTPATNYPGVPVAPGNRSAINAEKAKQYPYAKEIAKPSGFINTKNITIGSLVGKEVVLVDFWTYSCINCQRTIPYLNAWYARYHDLGLEIIGVHTPEFLFEHDTGNVQAAVGKFGIRYPVVLDNDYATWSSYNNHYWPADYLIDIDGFIVYQHYGEGDYAATEQEIQQLLRERADALGLKIAIPNTTTVPEGAVAVDFSRIGSPETYFGSNRNQELGNGPQLKPGLRTFTFPENITVNTLYLDGVWNITGEYAECAGKCGIRYRYDAKNVYLVANADRPVAVTVMLDGEPPGATAGQDVQAGTATIQEDRLYGLVSGSDYGVHTLELRIKEPGLRAYTFTFG